MTTYVKLNDDGGLDYMPLPKNISNPTEDFLAEYAADLGYKPLVLTESPTAYHVRCYDDTGECVTTIWLEPELESLRTSLKAKAEWTKQAALTTSSVVTVEGVGDVVWDTQASLNIIALSAVDLSVIDMAYILADETVINISNEQVAAISSAFMAHVQGIYATKTASFAAIEAAETVDELLYPED